MGQPVTYSSIRQYIDYLQQQMIHTNSMQSGFEKPTRGDSLEQQRVDVEILSSRQFRRLS